MNTYKEHPLASIFPMMKEVEIKELAEDIKQNGQRAPITLLDNKILDGRNRYRACQVAKIEPRFRDFNGNGDPLAFVISANIRRRHLTESQRAIIAAKLATMQEGRPSKTASRDAVSQTEAAKQLDVSRASVTRAKQVLAKATPEEIKKIEQGEKTVTEVARETKAKTDKPKEFLDKTGYPIPSEILEDWQHAESYNETLKQLHKIKLTVEKAIQEGNLAFREITNTTTADLKNAWSSLERVLPYSVCTTCSGQNRKKCTLCKGRGFISKFAYERFATKEVKEIRAKLKK